MTDTMKDGERLANKIEDLIAEFGADAIPMIGEWIGEWRHARRYHVEPHPNVGVEAAARWVEKRRDSYIEEHGSYDYSTGVTEFPGNGDEYVGELEEIIEGIRAIDTLHRPAARDAASREVGG